MIRNRILIHIAVFLGLVSPVIAKPINDFYDNRIVLYQDRDLNQQVLELKDGCVLELRGGTLKNGTIDCLGDLTIIGNGNTASDFPFIKCNGNLTITNVVFDGFKRTGVFIEYTSADCKKPKIEITNVQFDGNGKIERVLRSYLNKNIEGASIFIDHCDFTNITEYVVQFASNCTGRLTNNKIHDIGNSGKSHVSGLWLGYQDEFLARNMFISNNTIENILAPYNDADDGREAHGIIVYGGNNKILYNHINNIYSLISGAVGDPGKETEGIYIKGDNNEIAYNTLIDATGSGSDGAITIKHIGKTSKENLIHDNVISNRYSNGIVIYTDKSRVFNNQISLRDNSECGIYAFSGKGVTVYDNQIIGDDNIKHHNFSGAIIVDKCKDIIIRHNVINNVPLLLNCLQNGGTVNIMDNDMTMPLDRLLGNNTKYTSCIVFQGENSGKVVFTKNRISGKGTRGSQVIEFLDGSSIKAVQLKNNEISFSDTPQQETLLTYVIRKVPTGNIIVTDNRINIRGKYISSCKGKRFKRNVMELSNLIDVDL